MPAKGIDGGKLKILFVSDVSIGEVIGGAERVLFEQSTGMSRRGHSVHVLTRRLPVHDSDHKCIRSVHEWRYVCSQKNPMIFLHSTMMNTNRLFESLHQKHHFDCINFHQPFSAMGVNVSKMSRAVPKIYTCHSLSFEEFSSRFNNGNKVLFNISKFLQIQARKKIESYGLSKSNAIVVLSRFTKYKLVNIYNVPVEKIETIPGATDLNKFQPPVSKAAIREQLGIPQNKVIFFSLRNLVPRMGIENLILAFHRLEKEAADAQLVIGGTGPLEDGLIALTRSLGLERKVYFAGFISETQLPLYYQMADLFILPTKELEGFGLVTLEAMACGLPVVGTPIGGTKEILGKFSPRFLCENVQSDSIAKLTLEKYNMIKYHPLQWKHISEKCRQFVESNYSWDKNLDSLEQLFQKYTDK
jgi:glycosyltransferase involved in cell wall biosynthesis